METWLLSILFLLQIHLDCIYLLCWFLHISCQAVQLQLLGTLNLHLVITIMLSTNMDKVLQPFQQFQIKLEVITSATDNFNQDNCIGVGGFGKVYKGEVSLPNGRTMAAIKRLLPGHGQGLTEFQKEIEALSRYRHANLISLLGFCYQGDEMILVYEYAFYGSLEKHLDSLYLTWAQRMKICLDVAKGLSHLQVPRPGTHQRLFHCDIKSANILLDDQWNAKISDFGLSKMGPANEQHSVVFTNPAGTLGYLDPLYQKTHTLTKESDLYSFGVVLIEVLCGEPCNRYSTLVPRWIESYNKKNLIDSIFKSPKINPMDRRSLEIFSDIAYRCLKESRADRPKMAEVVTRLETALRFQKDSDHELQKSQLEGLPVVLLKFHHLKIQLEEIKSATKNFNDMYCIGVGGFGKVYKGEMSHSAGRSVVAIKRLDSTNTQGVPEFLKGIMMLSDYKHENLIPLLGFCSEGSEMIQVYEFASRGSLDNYLNSPHLTWRQRLKICLDVAKGLSYLHDPKETGRILVHTDIRSANILLDDQWNGKVSDFGLSIIGSANEHPSVIATLAGGYLGYCDPQFAMTHTLTKESDVYSFGVVLFEVLCGTFCCTYSNGRVQENLVPRWIESYKHKQLSDIIYKNPTIQPLDQSALETFSDIAFRCLQESREDRPKMADVVTELEIALECQEFSEWELPFDYEEMTNATEHRLNYRSKGELRKLLSKGVLLNSGKTWFSLNKKEHCEMISIAECLDPVPSVFESNLRSSEYNSRFSAGTYHSENGIFKTRVKTQYLSPGITYTVNLVFKIAALNTRKCYELVSLKYKLQGETENSISYLAYEREDGWWMCELYQFTSDHKNVDLEILFDGFDQCSSALMALEGIDFQPVEKDDEKLDRQPISDSYSYSDSDSVWEEKLPIDYVDIIKWSITSVQWTTMKEAYSIFCEGFLYDDGQKWVSLDKNGMKCHMLSARAACIKGRMNTLLLSLPESRFGEAAVLRLSTFTIFTKIQSQLASSQTTYASYLVYKLPEDQSGFDVPVKVKDKEDLGSDHIWYIYLVSPRTPVIRPTANQNSHNPLIRPKIKNLPQQRNDGWMEVLIWEFQTASTTERIPMHLEFSCCANIPDGLIIQGVEFRPI